jgi:hypothetical protein
MWMSEKSGTSMRVGLFLDFDGVITPKPVNMQIATLLGGEIEEAPEPRKEI